MTGGCKPLIRRQKRGHSPRGDVLRRGNPRVVSAFLEMHVRVDPGGPGVRAEERCVLTRR
jgi:hypothetical protein